MSICRGAEAYHNPSLGGLVCWRYLCNHKLDWRVRANLKFIDFPFR